jgi:hypothetical protein
LPSDWADRGDAENIRNATFPFGEYALNFMEADAGECQMRFRIASLAAFLFLSPAGVVHAEDPVADARAVISAQISALMNDDADKAYSLASPGIRSLYPDKKVFFAMVRDNYEAVYQAGTYAFGRSKLVGRGEVVLQEVMISAKQGKDWTAIYDMRLMDDGSYKVNGVRMIRNTASQGI